MILYVKGDLFESPAQVLVNTVNTEGVMGKGLALDFKRAFPGMFEEYRRLCDDGTIQIGGLWLYKSPNKWVLNFPTKRHWRQPSRLEYIEAGLRKFASCYAQMGVHSIAFPALGCGLGQLDFATQVQPLMEKYLRRLPIDVFIYPERASGSTNHVDQAQLDQWLRTEPSSLPFGKVWENLQHLIGRSKTFLTIPGDMRFTVTMSKNARQLQFREGDRIRILEYEMLVTVWQQLRSHGFTTCQTVPQLTEYMPYLVPLFSRLEYVSLASVAEQYNDLQNDVVPSLQVLPSAFVRSHSISMESQPQQGTLF